MRVLEFAFYSQDSKDMPHNYTANCICYPGTHDNDTIRGWLEDADDEVRALAVRYFGLNKDEGYVRGIIRGGMSSTANLFIAQMQDWLELDGSARINTPGILDGNWRWRMLPGSLTAKLASEIAAMTALYGRCELSGEE